MTNIPMPLSVVVCGREWHPYDIQFESPDGRYSVYLYAISEEHAHLQLDALKETGKVIGKVIRVEPR